MKRVIWALALAVMSAAYAEPNVTLTIFEGNPAIVQETRLLELQSGTVDYLFDGIPRLIDPSSVRIKTPGITVERQSFENASESAEKLLERYTGQSVLIVLEGGSIVEGTLLSFDVVPRRTSVFTVVIGQGDGSFTVVNMDQVQEIRCPALGECAAEGPALKWQLASTVSGRREIEVAYSTQGLNWNASYMLVLQPKANSGTFYGTATLSNRSGMQFDNAVVRLASGESRVADYRSRGKQAIKVYDEPFRETGAVYGMEAGDISDYHYYEVDEAMTLPSGLQQQINLFDPVELDAAVRYEFYHYRDPEAVTTAIVIKNSKSAGLGRPLPKGEVRLLQTAADGTEKLLGTRRLEHTAVDERVSLPLGNDLELTAKRIELLDYRVEERGHLWNIRVTVRNQKTDPVTVVVKETYEGTWEITKTTHHYEQTGMEMAEFPVPVPAKGEAVLEFTRVRHDYY